MVKLYTQFIACVAGAWKLWAKERTGAREGDTLLLARPFFSCAHHFQAPATQATQFKTQDAENHILFSGSAAHIRLDQIRECQ